MVNSKHYKTRYIFNDFVVSFLLIFSLIARLSLQEVIAMTQQLIGQRFMITTTYTIYMEDVHLVLIFILFHIDNIIG